MSTSILDALLRTLPADVPVRDIRVCAHFTAVVSRHTGLASTLRGLAAHHHGGPPISRAGDLLPCDARELAVLARSSSTLEASVGLAALNSLMDPTRLSCIEENAGALLAHEGRGRRVAVVGEFPFVRRLRELVGELWVFERRPAAGPGVLAEDEMPRLLPRAQVAGISSTTLLNHSLDRILELLPRDCYTVLVGPSTPMTPQLFELGVDALCGSVVADPPRALACLSQGATFRQVEGVRHVTALASGAPRAER